MAKVLGVLLTLFLLVAALGVGMYLFNGGNVFGNGKIGSPFTTYEDNDTNGTSSSSKIAFGSNIDGLSYTDANWKQEYTSIWAGQWIQQDAYGWQTLDGWLDTIYEADSTPVILWYYWGNDTTQENIENGIGNKSISEWKEMSGRIADSMNTIMGNNGGIVVVEPEFNKHGTENWTGFNQHLVEITDIIHERCQNCKVAIGFGNWDNEKWADFSDAVAKADMVGFNAIARYPDHSESDYRSLGEDSVAASSYLQQIFPGKPVILYDFGASSAPEPDFYYIQQEAVQNLVDNLDSLENSGTRIVMYKHFKDVVQYNTPDDQHWGLLEEDGMRKPAYDVWVTGVTMV